MILFFDTETTGKADFRAGPEAPHQPRIVQLAAILTDPCAREIMAMNVIIRPDGWTIPEETSAIHGITTEFAEQVGVPIKTALGIFGRMKRSATRYVAHNIDFDLLLIQSEFFRAFNQTAIIPADQLFCTMKSATSVCQIPSPNFPGEFKWPKLIEAHHFAFGTSFEGAHDALTDVRACVKVYFWLTNPNKQPVIRSDTQSPLHPVTPR